jgi:chromosome segregation ATPase
LKATQIDAIIEKLNDCAQHYSSAKNQLEFQRKGIDHMKKELAATQDKYSKLQSVETLKVELESVKNDLNWSFVKLAESEMDEMKQNLSATAKLFTELMAEMKSRDGTKEQLTGKLA